MFQNKWIKNNIARLLLLVLVLASVPSLSACSKDKEDVIVLRVSNWEEYMDEGDWDEEDAVELSDGRVICPENSLIEDYEDWFYETYGKKVRVEYSTFGTNEELYNQITIGDVYDVVCPSEYMIMKMMTEDMVEPLSQEFKDSSNENNFYVNHVSPYIKEVFDELMIEGKPISDYSAGYMWGTLGIVYNPDVVSAKEASTWKLLMNDKFRYQVTIKDSVRDAYIAGNAIYNYDKITASSFVLDENYEENLSNVINATDQKTVDGVEDVLSTIKDNVYSFETDSGKADMVTGKVVANQQWSGDAVYTMDQAEEDGVYLCYSAPDEATNLWFDGWCMLKAGVSGDADKKLAAEAFINYMSKSESAIRNMYYIGYTSVVSGAKYDGSNQDILDYIEYCYGAEVEESEVIDYDLSYFFGEDVSVIAPKEQENRQLYAQYPPEDVMRRSVVMAYFDVEGNARINRMWTNVRCFDLGTVLLP